MNIAVLTDPFIKPLYVARVRYLCDYLSKQGHVVEVFSEFVETIDFNHSYNLTTWRYVNSRLEWGAKSALSLLSDHKNRWFANKVISNVKHQPDVVIASTSFTFPLPAAYIVAQHFKSKLVVDLRDIAEQAPNQLIAHQNIFLKPLIPLYRNINIKRRNRVLLKADAITTVSPWHQTFLKQFNSNTHLIYNGYDESEFFPNPVVTDKFHVLYAGRIYDKSVTNPELFFQALKIIKELDLMPDLVVDFYSDVNGLHILRNYAQRYDVENLIICHDYVMRSDMNKLYNTSSVVLVFSNQSNSTTSHGIMTTKFFEALGAKRPILVVRSDEDCLESLVNQTNAGCAAKTVENVIHFLEQNYAIRNHNSYTIQNNFSDDFTRANQIQKFLQIMSNL